MLGCLWVSSCYHVRMEVPTALDTVPALRVEHKGFFRKQMRVGNFLAKDIRMGIIVTRSHSNSGFISGNIGEVLVKQKYSYRMVFPLHGEWDCHCASVLHETHRMGAFDVAKKGSLTVANLNQTFKPATTCTFTGPYPNNKGSWTLELSGVHYDTFSKTLMGKLKGEGVELSVEVISQGQRYRTSGDSLIVKKNESTPLLGIDVYGYRFMADSLTVGAVETIPPGRVWINHTEVDFALSPAVAMASVALLLHPDLTGSATDEVLRSVE